MTHKRGERMEFIAGIIVGVLATVIILALVNANRS